MTSFLWFPLTLMILSITLTIIGFAYNIRHDNAGPMFAGIATGLVGLILNVFMATSVAIGESVPVTVNVDGISIHTTMSPHDIYCIEKGSKVQFSKNNELITTNVQKLHYNLSEKQKDNSSYGDTCETVSIKESK